MPVTPVNLGVRSNPGRTGAISAARLINCRALNAGEEGKIRFPIVACDGFEAWSSSFAAISGTGTHRAGFVLSDSAMYVVSGTKVVKLNTSGAPTEVSGSVTASGVITMARNRREPNAQIGIVSSAGNAFYILENDTLTDHTSVITALGSAGTLTSIAGMDGYFVFFFDNGEFFVSEIDDGDTVDPLNFAKAESNPDAGVKVLTRGRDLILAGDRSTEFWVNSGAADFPFERSHAADYGCYAAPSMINVTHARPDGEVIDTIAMAATNSQGAYVGVVLLNGYSALKVSDEAVDRSVLAETDKSSIKARCYTEAGSVIYAISGSTFTWEYNFATGFWNERTSDGLAFHRISDAFSFNGMRIVADYTLAKYHKLRSDLVPGSNSVVTLRHSNNNAHTWLVTRTKTLSNASNLTQRIKFNRLGQSKEDGKVFQITISNAVMEDGVGNTMTVQPPAVHAYPSRMRFYAMYIDTIPGGSQTSTPKGITGLAVNAVALAS